MDQKHDYQKYVRERERASERLQEQVGQRMPIEPIPQAKIEEIIALLDKH